MSSSSRSWSTELLLSRQLTCSYALCWLDWHACKGATCTRVCLCLCLCPAAALPQPTWRKDLPWIAGATKSPADSCSTSGCSSFTTSASQLNLHGMHARGWSV